MKFGAHLLHISAQYSPEDIVHFAQAVEQMGYDSVWASDHIVFPTGEVESRYPYRETGRFPLPPDTPWLECVTTLAFVAGATSRVYLGTTVMVLPYRNPVLNAKMLGTLQVLSNNRLILGAGAGWMREEAEALGMPWDHRGQRTDEHIQVLRAIWTQEEPRFEGRFYRIAGVRCEPRPTVPPPIWIGGHERAGLRRAGVLGDGWHAAFHPPEDLASRWQTVQQFAREAGRDPASLTLSVRLPIRIRNQPEEGPPLVGSVDQIKRWLQEYQRLGVQHVLLEPSLRQGVEAALEVLDRFAREVRPEFA